MKLCGKKNVFTAVFLITVIICFICVMLAVNQQKNQPKKRLTDGISKALSIDVTDGTVLYSEDSHGGFHGDGMSFTKIQFKSRVCLEEIENSADWSRLPLPEEMSVLLYGGKIAGLSYEPLRFGSTTAPCMSKAVENGYYYFSDRLARDNPKSEKENFLERGSYNFDLAIYDADTDIMYYIVFDT